MKTLFLGTSDFAATVLRRLAGGAHRPALVVAPPDRRRGRGRRLGPPPVAAVAGELGLDLTQESDVNDAAARDRLLGAGAEVAVVCAFGQIVKEPLLSAIEMLNVHPSLLPRWRGAAPIERAIMAGDEVTGVCVMQLTAGLDSGPVALREQIPIAADDDYGTLSERLAEAGGALLGTALDRRADGALEFTEQAGDGVTYAEKIEPPERRVDPSNPAAVEARRIRALTPHVGAFVTLGDETRLGLRDPRLLEQGPPPGEFEAIGGSLALGCGSGAIAIGAVQPPGRRWMDAGDYLRGYGTPAAAAQPLR